MKSSSVTAGPSWTVTFASDARSGSRGHIGRPLTRLGVFVLPILLSSVLSGCGGQKTSTTAPNGAGQTAALSGGELVHLASVPISLDPKTFAFLPAGDKSKYAGTTFRIGYGKGGASAIVKLQGTLEARFKPLGVSVEWLQFPMGPQMMEGIGAGSLDLGSCASTPPIFAQAANVDFVYVATTPPGKSNGAILIPKNSPIKSVKDLRGKRIAFQPGSVWHYALVKILEANGLKYDDIIPAKMAPADSSTAFNSGAIDAWVQGEPYVTLAQRKSGARILVNTAAIGNTGGFYLGSAPRVRQYPELFRIALEELKRAGDWMKQNPHQAAVLTTERAGLDVATIEKTIREGNNTRFLPITPDVIKSQQQQADLFSKIKILPTQIDVKQKVLTAKEYAVLLPDNRFGLPDKARIAANPAAPTKTN
ncbi:putative aliphatic sulfonates-binding protein [Abditibacteriota bacterium]|nr:putative aliphatic sulfonates-binding protein [Abditibacteriota bacterium]